MSLKLTARQKKFCQEYMVDLNGTQAAIRAGYSKNGARVRSAELLANSNVQPYLKQLITKAEKRTEITVDSILTRLDALADRCMQAEPVMIRVDGELVESGEYRFDSSGANKSLELLGKYKKMWTDKQEIEHTGEVRIITVPTKKPIGAGVE